MSSGDRGTNGDPFSLDIWSKYWLGWVSPTLLTEENPSSDILSVGTQKEDGTPRVLRINIPGKEHEYYLLENRQFEGWDEGMGTYYPGENGGILLWHIDEQAEEFTSKDRQPAVTPLFREDMGDGKPTLIGVWVRHQYPFFDRRIQEEVYENVNGYLNLPVYANENILRRTYSCVGVKFTTESGSKMNVQVRYWNHIWDAGKVTKKPTTTSTGTRTYTCTWCGATKTESVPKLKKAANPLKIRVSSRTCKRKKLKKPKTFNIGVTKAQGKVTYALSGNGKKAKIRVTTKGKVIVPKKCKKGKYTITVRAAGNSRYKAGDKKVVITVK
jgi:hypothetical protein